MARRGERQVWKCERTPLRQVPAQHERLTVPALRATGNEVPSDLSSQLKWPCRLSRCRFLS